MNKYLVHWGIKGQKWGVRRYQNADGSLTPAGKKRYSYLSEVRDEELRVARVNRQNNKSVVDRAARGEIALSKHDIDIYKERAKSWLAAETAISNMKIDVLNTRAADIIKAGREASIKATGFSMRSKTVDQFYERMDR